MHATMKRTLWLGSALVLPLLLWASRPAHAGTFVGVDANAAKIVGDGSEAFAVGYGGNIRAGWEVPIPVLTIQLGALFRYDQWAAATQGVSGTLKATDIMVGGRAGIGVLLKPWVGAYFGYGHLSSDIGGASAGDGGSAILLGGGLDIALPIVAVGIHVDWNKDSVTFGNGSTQSSANGWVGAGANLTLSF
jgi:hypothetical protein